MAMKPAMKMMLVDQIAKPDYERRSEYGGDNRRRMIGYDRNYDMENRRRYAGGDNWEGNYDYSRSYYEPESRRRRDSRGRYMTGRMEDDDDEIEMRSQTWYPPHGRLPPNMNGSKYGFGDVYAYVDAPGAMNRPSMMGDIGSDMNRPVDEHTARMWVGKMEGGEKYKPEQADQHRNSICPGCDKWEFYVAMNAMYSDHCETAKKLGMDKPEFYAHLAKDFLMDSDAGPHKLRKYMEIIPK